MAKIFTSDGVYIAKSVKDHLNTWEKKPADILLEDFEKEAPSMMLQQLAAAEKSASMSTDLTLAFGISLSISESTPKIPRHVLTLPDACRSWPSGFQKKMMNVTMSVFPLSAITESLPTSK